ncbi:MAG: hypothetical protein ACFB51_02000 [Anaerolineae bacterium]
MITGQPTRKPEAILRDLVALIEEIRTRRQSEAAEVPTLKPFSQRELNAAVCPSYKNYLLGRTNRLPQRDMVIAIADYLECPPAERDDLLMCAGYLPASYVLRDDEYRAAVAHAAFVARLLPLPAVVIGRYAQTLYANQPVFAKNMVPSLEYWQQNAQDNVIAWFFDPTLQAHHYYTASTTDWQHTARGAAELVYLTNSMRLRDPRFRQLIQASRDLPDFAAMWDTVTAAPPSIYAEYGEMRMQTRYLAEPIRELCWLMPITPNLEVSVVVGIPMDEAARYVYTQLGCDLDAVQWQAMLKDFSFSR